VIFEKSKYRSACEAGGRIKPPVEQLRNRGNCVLDKPKFLINRSARERAATLSPAPQARGFDAPGPHSSAIAPLWALFFRLLTQAETRSEAATIS
jgi:hypothetical protein